MPASSSEPSTDLRRYCRPGRCRRDYHTDHDCSTASVRGGIADLQASVASLEITGTNAEKNRANLQGKLAAAQVKVDEAKPLDAAAKLTDFRTKVQQLRDADKISQEDAQALTSAVNAVITCLGGTD